MHTTSESKEGEVAKAIESQTVKIPSDLFLWAGLGALGLAFGLQATKQKHLGLAIGHLASSFLIMGLYNKTVKQQGHDQIDKTVTS